eukprot:m.302266 g.302266  ORF g.302266 m.302266 type:complete len:397 (-) comp27290_c0_seq6:777-1967(-)
MFGLALPSSKDGARPCFGAGSLLSGRPLSVLLHPTAGAGTTQHRFHWVGGLSDGLGFNAGQCCFRIIGRPVVGAPSRPFDAEVGLALQHFGRDALEAERDLASTPTQRGCCQLGPLDHLGSERCLNPWPQSEDLHRGDLAELVVHPAAQVGPEPRPFGLRHNVGLSRRPISHERPRGDAASVGCDGLVHHVHHVNLLPKGARNSKGERRGGDRPLGAQLHNQIEQRVQLPIGNPLLLVLFLLPLEQLGLQLDQVIQLRVDLERDGLRLDNFGLERCEGALDVAGGDPTRPGVGRCRELHLDRLHHQRDRRHHLVGRRSRLIELRLELPAREHSHNVPLVPVRLGHDLEGCDLPFEGLDKVGNRLCSAAALPGGNEGWGGAFERRDDCHRPHLDPFA